MCGFHPNGSHLTVPAVVNRAPRGQVDTGPPPVAMVLAAASHSYTRAPTTAAAGTQRGRRRRRMVHSQAFKTAS